jgi:TRAP-type C4-dicarboxylate transport system permease small subunit
MQADTLQRVQKVLTRITEVVCACFLVVLVANIFVSVLSRYVFFIPLNFANQLSKYLVMWLAFMGSSLAIERGEHVAVELLLDRVSIPVRNVLLILLDILVSIFFVTIIYFGFKFSINAKISGFRDPLIWHMNLMYAYLSVPVGFIFMLIQANLCMVIEIRK